MYFSPLVKEETSKKLSMGSSEGEIQGKNNGACRYDELVREGCQRRNHKIVNERKSRTQGDGPGEKKRGWKAGGLILPSMGKGSRWQKIEGKSMKSLLEHGGGNRSLQVANFGKGRPRMENRRDCDGK